MPNVHELAGAVGGGLWVLLLIALVYFGKRRMKR